MDFEGLGMKHLWKPGMFICNIRSADSAGSARSAPNCTKCANILYKISCSSFYCQPVHLNCGYILYQIVIFAGVDLFGEMMQMADNNYPEMLRICLIINGIFVKSMF